MRFLVSLLATLIPELAAATDISKSQLSHPATPNPDVKDNLPPIPGWGESCRDVCDPPQSVTCKDHTCVCDPSFPILYKEKKRCLKALEIGDDCVTDSQCHFHDKNTLCQHYSGNFTECICKDSYEAKTIKGSKPPTVCIPDPSQIKKDLPTFLGFGFMLSVMSALICLVLKMFAKARFVRPRSYANAAIPPPLTVSETYAAFALASANSNRSTPIVGHPRVLRSASSSRRPSYVSLNAHRTGELLRLASSNSLGHHRMGSRRTSMNSVRSFRSQTGLILPDIHPEPDHYILYMIRRPSHSVASDTTTSTTCDTSSSPRTPKSTEQILAVYHPVPEHSILELGKMGPSHTSSTFRTLSSEDVFQEEEEEEMEDEAGGGKEEEKEEDNLGESNPSFEGGACSPNRI